MFRLAWALMVFGSPERLGFRIDSLPNQRGTRFVDGFFDVACRFDPLLPPLIGVEDGPVAIFLESGEGIGLAFHDELAGCRRDGHTRQAVQWHWRIFHVLPQDFQNAFTLKDGSSCQQAPKPLWDRYGCGGGLSTKNRKTPFFQ